MKKILMIILMVSVVFMSCSRKEQAEKKVESVNTETNNEDSLFDENGRSDEKIELMFGYDNNNSLLFENSDNTVDTKLQLECGKYELQVGILVFVDGILQPVSIDGDREESLNILKVNEKASYNMKFKLASGTEGENVRIDTVSLLNPNFEITEKTKQFGLCFASTSPLPYWTDCSISVKEPEGAKVYEIVDIPDKIKEQYIIKNNEGVEVNNLKSSMNIQYIQNGEEAKKLQMADGKLNSHLRYFKGFNNCYILL